MKISALALLASLCAIPALAQTALPDAPMPTPQFAPPAVPNGPTVILDTSMGRITCRLFDKQAPIASANFTGLITGSKDWIDPNNGQRRHGMPFYDGVTFHRVIPGFMIQGGDRTGTGAGDAGYMFKNEVDPGLTFNMPGRLAMANSGPDTNGTQFFITETPQPSLDGGYTIFGQCDPASVDVVSAIARVQRDPQDKPTTPVTIKKAYVIQDGQPLPPDPMPPAPPSTPNLYAPAAAPAPAPPAAPPAR